MSKWQPMDTVPKDRQVLLDISYWYPGDRTFTEAYVVAQWDEDEHYPWYAGDVSYERQAPVAWMEIPRTQVVNPTPRKPFE